MRNYEHIAASQTTNGHPWDRVLFLKKSDGEFEQRSTFDGL
jgi:hypothetical protein